jgi:hypothetical protein
MALKKGAVTNEIETFKPFNMNLTILSIESKTGLEAVLSTLGFACAPTSVFHVGMSDVNNPTCVWSNWGIQKAVIVEADKVRLQQVNEAIVQKGIKAENLYSVAEVVNSEVGQVPFYKASHPRESGLINPEALRGYWPSLMANSSASVSVVTIDDIWQASINKFHSAVEVTDEQIKHPVNSQNWLIIDCLPAKTLLEGAKNLLEHTTVVCVRTLREVLKSSVLLEASLQSIDDHLLTLGFNRVALVTDSHPGVSHAVYCRDMKSIFEAKQLETQAQLEQQAQVTKQAVEQGARQQIVQAELSAAITAHEQKHLAQESAEATLKEQATKLTSDLDARTKASQLHEQAIKTLQAERDTATAEKVAVGKQLAERDTQVATANKQLAETETQAVATNKQLAERDTEIATANKQLQERDTQLATALEASNQHQASVQAVKKELTDKAAELEAAKQQHAATQAAQQAAESASKEQVTKLTSDLDARTKASQQHEQTIKTLQAEREAANAEKAAVGKQLAESDTQLATANKQLAEKDAQVATVSKQLVERDTQLKAANKQLTERDAQFATANKQLQEKDAQLATAVKANEQQKPALAESDRLRLEAQAALKTAQTETQKLKTTLQEETQRIERLTAENQELAHRQQLMNEELVKAEGQITLIKDLLLREPGI